VRRGLRDILSELERDHPYIRETLLSAMGKIDTGRLLDTRFLDLEAAGDEAGFFEGAQDLIELKLA
jgi:tRNA 2-thiocytidine biosynthesis protein TtcA